MTWEGLSPPYATIVADPPWEYAEGWPPTRWSNEPVGPRHPLPYSAMPANEGEAVTEMTLTPRGHQTTRTDLAVEALRLANDSTASAQEVVDRATAYLEFLSKAANTTATG